MQSAKASPQLPKPSALAKPEISFQWEPFSRVFAEVAPLAFRTYGEAGVLRKYLPFDADWERYFQFEDTGIFSILTARRDGKMVGYVACIVLPHIQVRTELCATVNAIFLAPEQRSGTLGVRMLKRAVADLQAKGVHLFHIAAKEKLFGSILERIGFEVEETIYVKYTGAK